MTKSEKAAVVRVVANIAALAKKRARTVGHDPYRVGMADGYELAAKLVATCLGIGGQNA